MQPWGSIIDVTPPDHFNESPPINGTTTDTTPEISVDVTDISGVEPSSIRFYVKGFMVFYNITAIPGGYDIAYWHETGFAIGEYVTCRIVADDIFGNRLDFTWQFQVVDQAPFTVDLHAGWNLVSFPLIPVNTSIESVLSSIAGQWDMAQFYDAFDTADHWKTYATFKPPVLNDLHDLDNTMGFWLHVTNATTLGIYGSKPISTDIPLLAGWNMVGYPTQESNTSVSDATWGTGIDRVMVCNLSDPYNLMEVGPGYIMKPGEGYFVHAIADAIWTVDY